jgi:hypothetical protein
VDLGPEHLTVALAGGEDVVVSGRLFAGVKAEGSTWFLGGQKRSRLPDADHALTFQLALGCHVPQTHPHTLAPVTVVH